MSARLQSFIASPPRASGRAPRGPLPLSPPPDADELVSRAQAEAGPEDRARDGNRAGIAGASGERSRGTNSQKLFLSSDPCIRLEQTPRTLTFENFCHLLLPGSNPSDITKAAKFIFEYQNGITGNCKVHFFFKFFPLQQRCSGDSGEWV